MHARPALVEVVLWCSSAANSNHACMPGGSHAAALTLSSEHRMVADEAVNHQGSMRCAWKGALSSRACPACCTKPAVLVPAGQGGPCPHPASSLPTLPCEARRQIDNAFTQQYHQPNTWIPGCAALLPSGTAHLHRSPALQHV